jgi:DNA-directed RNA polymerase III subunit RPC1
MASGGESIKAQVVDKIPKRFKELKFGIQYAVLQKHRSTRSLLSIYRSNQDIVNQAVLEVSDRMLYDVEKLRRPVQHGPLDARLVGTL